MRTTSHKLTSIHPSFGGSSYFFSSSLKFNEMPFTQCRSSVGVEYPSPLKTCPKWPPLEVSEDFPNGRQHCTHQFVQVISMRVINIDLSSWRVTAPGTVSKNAGHPQPEALELVKILTNLIYMISIDQIEPRYVMSRGEDSEKANLCGKDG